MRKRDELTDPNSCLNKAHEEEMTFVFLGRDLATPKTIRDWIDERIRLGLNVPDDNKMQEAEQAARTIIAEQDAEFEVKDRRRLELARRGAESLTGKETEEFLKLRKWCFAYHAARNSMPILDVSRLESEARPMTQPEIDRLLAVIREVHSQHADDLCWMPADVNRIFATAGLPPQDLRVGDTEAMRRNCDRYIACLENGGPWKSYAELEAENARLREALKPFADYARQMNGFSNPLRRDDDPLENEHGPARYIVAPTLGDCRKALAARDGEIAESEGAK